MLTDNIIQTEQVTLMCLGTHTHTRVTIKEKEAMNLRDCMGQCMVDIKWRKGKEEMV